MDELGEENRFGVGRRYRSRDFLGGGSESIDLLIESLHRLEAETHPGRGEGSAQSKDAKARAALNTTGRLVDILAGWALDHMAGLAKSGLGPMHYVPPALRALPDYRAALSEVDSHKHEISGGILNQFAAQEDWDAETVRQFCINVLQCNPSGMNVYAKSKFLEALSALQYGEVLPVLAPAGTRLKVRYQELHLQLRAICIVRYRQKCGLKKHEAQKQVAEALFIDDSTVKGWELRLRSALGYLRVSSALQKSENSASTVQNERRALYALDLTDIEREQHQSLIDWCETLYGAQALQELAEQYRKLRQEKAEL